MDRRQQKTRAAIFSAFEKLLSSKNYNRITVQEIIDEANIGRTTFYAHFETKDDLLKSLCEELFGHIVDSALDHTHKHGLYSDKKRPESIFCHLLQHLQENDNNILELLSCESNDIFLRYFKDCLSDLIRTQFSDSLMKKTCDVPTDFLINHISGSFVEMVLWWINEKLKYTPEQLDEYFRCVLSSVI
jgi:transcriptional regulator, tetR family